jgi:hypothetical protein
LYFLTLLLHLTLYRTEHSAIRQKLPAYGVRGKLFGWLSDYLISRRQRVRVENLHQCDFECSNLWGSTGKRHRPDFVPNIHKGIFPGVHIFREFTFSLSTNFPLVHFFREFTFSL